MLKTQLPRSPRFQSDMAAPISIGAPPWAIIKSTLLVVIIKIKRKLRFAFLNVVRGVRSAIRKLSYYSYDQAEAQARSEEHRQRLRDRHYHYYAFHPHFFM